MSAILCAAAPLIFHAALPENLPLYFVRLALFITVSLSVGSVLGLTIKKSGEAYHAFPIGFPAVHYVVRNPVFL